MRIIGPNTIGGKPNEAVKIADITDGTANTIMVVEVTGVDIPWAEPRDLTVDEFMALVAANRVSRHPGGFNALMGDGSVRFFNYSITPELLRSILTRNEGNKIAPP